MDTVHEELKRMRRCNRDLVALSTLPLLWMSATRQQIAESVVSVLLDTLHIDVAFAVLTDPIAGQPVRVIRTRQATLPERDTDWGASFSPLLDGDLDKRPGRRSGPRNGPAAARVRQADRVRSRLRRVDRRRRTQKRRGSARVIGGLNAAIERGETRWSDDYRFERRDGSYAAILDRGYIVYDEHRKATRMIGAMFDHSERKKAEAAKELALMLDRAIRNAESSAVGVNAAPVIAVETIVKTVRVCERQRKKLADLLNELLDLTRIRLGKLELRTQAVDLAVTAREVAERFREEAQKRGSSLTISAQPGTAVGRDQIR